MRVIWAAADIYAFISRNAMGRAVINQGAKRSGSWVSRATISAFVYHLVSMISWGSGLTRPY